LQDSAEECNRLSYLVQEAAKIYSFTKSDAEAALARESVYQGVLGKYPIWTVERAFKDWKEDNNQMPMPSDLRKLVMNNWDFDRNLREISNSERKVENIYEENDVLQDSYKNHSNYAAIRTIDKQLTVLEDKVHKIDNTTEWMKGAYSEKSSRGFASSYKQEKETALSEICEFKAGKEKHLAEIRGFEE